MVDNNRYGNTINDLWFSWNIHRTPFISCICSLPQRKDVISVIFFFSIFMFMLFYYSQWFRFHENKKENEMNNPINRKALEITITNSNEKLWMCSAFAIFNQSMNTDICHCFCFHRHTNLSKKILWAHG